MYHFFFFLNHFIYPEWALACASFHGLSSNGIHLDDRHSYGICYSYDFVTYVQGGVIVGQ